MAIDPEVIPSSSSAGENAIHYIPKWAIYAALGILILIVVSILKTIFPLILMSLVIGLIWKQARNY